MKTILLSVVAALTLTALPAVHADDSVDVKAPRVTKRYMMDQSEFRQYANRYQLQNGQQLSFKQVMTMRYAILDDGQYVRIYPTSAKTFVSDDGVRFEFRDEGETVAITDFAKLPMAKVVAGSPLMMAARR
ncbi:gel scht [Duganella sp. FT94W]|uniref:Gel scht n=1 Tax=Duganella lactea TaxID=2692173 RepID=A0ABW9V4J7_9BURK|nr:gel scht [Duganella lactea]MYM33856.1 gel scht [Duganella lactea]